MTFSPEAMLDMIILVLFGGGGMVLLLMVIYFIAQFVVRNEDQGLVALTETRPDTWRVARRESPPDPDEWEVPLPHDEDGA